MLEGKRVFLIIVNPDKGKWKYGDSDPRDPLAFVRLELEDDAVGWPANACRSRIRKGDVVLLKFSSKSLGAWRGIYAAGVVVKPPHVCRKGGWWFEYRHLKPATERLMTHPILESGFKQLFPRAYGSPIQELDVSKMRLCERLLRTGSGLSTESAEEGDRYLAAHYRIERSVKLRELAKAHWAKSPKGLACAVCGFDFMDAYGTLGEDYIEVHHLRPLAAARGARKTSLTDLAPVCANCHRIVHRRLGDPLSLVELKQVVTKQRRSAKKMMAA